MRDEIGTELVTVWSRPALMPAIRPHNASGLQVTLNPPTKMNIRNQRHYTTTRPEKTRHTAKVNTTNGWKNILIRHSLLHLGFISLLSAQGLPNLVRAEAEAAPPISGALGKIQSISSDSIDVGTKSGVVHIGISRPLTTYKQKPSDLSHVTSASYVGIPSVTQPDGKELAKLVLIFPPELKGAAEGSVLTDAAPNQSSHSRMTNGSVSRPTAPHSRMTNGTVQTGDGTSLIVKYQDGAQTISVPADVPVMEVAPESVTLGVGDTVYVATDQQADGSLITNKVFQFIAAAQ